MYQVRTNLKMITSLDSFTAEGDETKVTLAAFRETFGRDDMILVMAAGDVFSMDYLNRLKALHADLEQIDLPADPKAPAIIPPATGEGVQPPGPAQPPAPAAADDGAEGDEGDEGDDPFGNMDSFEDPEAPVDAGEADKAGESGKRAPAKDDWAGEAGSIIDEVTSLINMRKVRFSDDTLRVGDLLDPFPTEADLPRIKQEALSERAVVGQVLGADAKHSLLAVRTLPMSEDDSDRVAAAIRTLMKRHEAPGFRLGAAGTPALTSYLKMSMFRDLRVMFATALGIMLIVLGLIFRHPVGVLGPILVIVMSIMWTFGFMATFGLPMTLISNIMPAFLMAVGLGDAIHLLSVYRDQRRDGVENEEAIVYALSTTATPLLFTTMTTAVGLLSFNFATVSALAQMGTAAAVGVFVALLHSLVFLPVVLTFNRKSLLGAKKVEHGDRLDRALWVLTGLTTLRDGKLTPWKSVRVVINAAVLLTVALWGMSQLGVSHDPLSWLPDDVPLKQVFKEVDKSVGGTATMQLFIDVKSERGVRDLEFLKGLEAIDAHIKTYVNPRFGKIVTGSISVLDIVKETNKSLHGGDEAWYRLPDTQRGASDLLFMFENSGPDDLRRLATADLRTTQMTVRLRWLDANSYPDVARHVQVGIDKHLAAHARVRQTGAMMTLGSTVAGLLDNVMRSFGAAFIVITLFMIVLLRDWRLGLVAMAPNLMPIAFIMGLMGWWEIPIDMGNLMLASIAIGIAVDDTIHFLHHFRVGRSVGMNTNEAIGAAVQHAGRAMFATSLVLTLGFSVFTTASMAHMQRFGGLIALTATLAFLVDVIFAPALLRLIYDRGAGRSAAGPASSEPAAPM